MTGALPVGGVPDTAAVACEKACWPAPSVSVKLTRTRSCCPICALPGVKVACVAGMMSVQPVMLSRYCHWWVLMVRPAVLASELTDVSNWFAVGAALSKLTPPVVSVRVEPVNCTTSMFSSESTSPAVGTVRATVKALSPVRRTVKSPRAPDMTAVSLPAPPSRVSLPAPPVRVSLPAMPWSRSLPVPPVSELFSSLPVPRVAAPVLLNTKFSTLLGSVKSTMMLAVSVPSLSSSTMESPVPG